MMYSMSKVINSRWCSFLILLPRISDIITFAQNHLDIEIYLPSFKDPDKLPDCSWICNTGKRIHNISIVNTIIHKEFKEFALTKAQVNEKTLVTKKKLMVTVAPKFSALFKTSKSVSSIHSSFYEFNRGQRKVQNTISTWKKKKSIGSWKRSLLFHKQGAWKR